MCIRLTWSHATDAGSFSWALFSQAARWTDNFIFPEKNRLDVFTSLFFQIKTYSSIHHLSVLLPNWQQRPICMYRTNSPTSFFKTRGFLIVHWSTRPRLKRGIGSLVPNANSSKEVLAASLLIIQSVSSYMAAYLLLTILISESLGKPLMIWISHVKYLLVRIRSACNRSQELIHDTVQLLPEWN